MLSLVPATENPLTDKPATTLFAQNVQLTGHNAEILSCKFSNDGKLLGSAGMDKSVFLWKAAGSCENVSVMRGHNNAITCLTFEHTNELVYTASADKSLIVWDIEAAKLRKKYKGHTAIIHSVSAPKKLMNLMASASDDALVKVFDTRTKKETHTFAGKFPMTSVCMSETGDKVFAGGIDNVIRCFGLKSGKQEYSMEGHNDTVSSLALSHDGSFMMSNSFDETVRVWDVRAFVSAPTRLTKVFSGHSQGTEKSLLKGGWSFDGLYIATGSTDK